MSPRSQQRSKGFSLVEVTMAIGLMSFCLVAMVGILPVGMSQERKSTDQLMAMQALSAVTADFKSSDLAAAKTKRFELLIPANKAVLALDRNYLSLNDPRSDGVKEFHVVYTIERPSSNYYSYRLSARVYRDPRTDPTQNDKASYVESVVMRSDN